MALKFSKEMLALGVETAALTFSSPGCSCHHILIKSISKNKEFSKTLALPINPVYPDMKLTDSSLKSHSVVGGIGTENMMQYELVSVLGSLN